jgi:D-sedoheptulose 7-phosphate isomerase
VDVTGAVHIAELAARLDWMAAETPRIEAWGRQVADVLLDGGRLLAAGNGGSAAEAQHLTAELVGRYRSERVPLAALALHADTSSLTAIANDYGQVEMFARQVRAHGRPGDLMIALSTSGCSPNVVAAARTAAELGLQTLALTGPYPNVLADACADAVCVPSESPPTVQELHLVAVHLLCGAVDARIAERDAAAEAAA